MPVRARFGMKNAAEIGATFAFWRADLWRETVAIATRRPPPKGEPPGGLEGAS